MLTLMVVSLLMVLVLSFVVFVRMEIRTTVNQQQLHQARSNAKLGANIAVARLQELAGPDTRVTAPVLDDSATPNQRLIGQAVDAAPYLPQGTGVAYNPLYARTRGYFISHDPATIFDPLSYQPFDGNGNVTSDNLLLVGGGSASAEKDANGDGVPDDFVAAPLRPLSSGPGGGFAYWISDEGQKAQVNLTDPIHEETGRMDDRAQVATIQRMGTERLLPGYDLDTQLHNDYLRQAVSPEQLDITGWGENNGDFSKPFIHDITLQSLGLPTNTRRGGLKRDFTAVVAEAEGHNGVVDPSGNQWTQLLEYQEDRLARWRAETVAKPASPPTGLPLRHWNALDAITLRPDQADPSLNDRPFPPMTDMHVQWDLGGATWRQLITWITLRDRLETSRGVQAGRRWQENMNLSPVVAKISVANYITVDYPDAAFHWIPTVTLWNPYDVPLAMDPARPWRVLLDMDDGAIFGGYWMRLKVRHSRWEAPSTSNFSHIQGENGKKDELWTPKFRLEWPTNSDANFVFRIRAADGDTDVVIPPGEARMFALREHRELTRDSNDKISTEFDILEGLAPDGQYSVYLRHDLEEQIFEDSKTYVGGNSNFDNRSNDVHDINEHAYKAYHEAAGGYNEWHTTSRRNRTYGDVDTAHLPYPFPLDTNLLAQTGAISQLAKIPPPGDEDICINQNGLDGWDILQVGAEIGRHNEGGANFRNLRLKLDSGSENWPMVDVLHPNQDIPDVIHAARCYDSDNPYSDFGQITPVWTPIDIPADNEPFTPATPGFPAWGLSYGLRLPEHSYVFNDTTNEGAAVAARIRWLQDFNPFAPFPNRDPSSRMQVAGWWRHSRRGFKSPPMYVGGFFMGDNRYADLSWNTPNDLNQFIGHSDDTLPGYAPGDTPLAVLSEVPRDSEDIASVASLMHAPLVSTHHALHPSNPEALPGGSAGDENNKDAVTYTVAYWTGHPGFAQPTYMIGNSMAHPLVSRDRAEQSFYPHPNVASPTESIPYLTSKGPADMSNGEETYLAMYDFSWIYNEVFWDDFLFTPEANRRLQWQPPFTADDRDFTRSAERLLVSGAFNVNSVSIPAWAVLLESMMGVDPKGDGSMADFAPFSRFLTPPEGRFDVDQDDYESLEAYAGYRALTRTQIWDDNGTPDDTSDDSGLAPRIVEQVKLRGPFLSMSDFVNRALLAEADDPDGLGMSGALQTAIDDAGLNEAMGTPAVDAAWVDGEEEYNLGNQFFEFSASNVNGPTNSSAPGMLMQADVLARIGAVLQARSDTFKIRAAGLLGDADAPTARAWCEVTVQRVPDYVDDTVNAPGDLPADLSGVNVAFGRKFRILSFRWLSEEEI